MVDQTEDPSAIPRRVERLERENRRLKVVGTLALALLICLLTMGQTRPGKVIEAETFLVKDSSGKVLAKLSGATGHPLLDLYGADGGPCVHLTADATNGYLTLSSGFSRNIFLLAAEGDFPLTPPPGDTVFLVATKSVPRLVLQDSQGFATSIAPRPLGKARARRRP